MQIKLADNTTITALKVDGGKQYIQGAQRDVLAIHIAKDAATFDALDTATGDATKTARITIIGDDGSEALHEGYILRQSLASKPVLIAPETADAPARYEERYIVELAQETYTERQIRQVLSGSAQE